MTRFGNVMISAAVAIMLLPGAGLAQSPGATGPMTPPAATGPAPSPGQPPAEVMPPSARTGNGGSSSPAATADVVFARDAAAANLAELRMGELAARQAQAANVKTFARRMVADHTKLAQQLDAIARHAGLVLPSMLDSKDSAALASLAHQQGTAFDRAYIRAQLTDHRSALALFQREAARGTDPDLKRFATEALPTLQQHLAMADAAEKMINERHTQR